MPIPSRDEAFDELKFLHEFYKSELKREHGLWRPDLNQPDFEGIAAWYLDVYQTRRIAGWSRSDARAEYVQAIRSSDEWRDKNADGRPSPSPSPSPLTPRLVQVADRADGPFHPRMYSYWSNAFVNNGNAYVFVGHSDSRPRFFEVQPERVRQLQNLHMPYGGTTEGWSWDSHGWIYLLNGPRLRRVNPFSGDDHVVLDITHSHPNCRLWQSHSSDDGTTHCATVEQITPDGPYRRIGTIAMRRGEVKYFPAVGKLDESQITEQWLIIKEERDRNNQLRLDNRVVNLDSGQEYWILDEAGAVGHSDCDHGMLVGEDNQVGACILWDLNRVDVPKILFRTWNMGHVSVRNGRILVSDNEWVSLLDLNGNLLAPRHAHGVAVADYDSQVRANLDPTGRVACYMAHGHVYLLVL